MPNPSEIPELQDHHVHEKKGQVDPTCKYCRYKSQSKICVECNGKGKVDEGFTGEWEDCFKCGGVGIIK